MPLGTASHPLCVHTHTHTHCATACPCPCKSWTNGTLCYCLPLQVLDYWHVLELNKWGQWGIQWGMVLIYRVLFWAALVAKEHWKL